MKGHYHLFVLSVGKEGVERIYVPMLTEDEPRHDAEGRLKRTQRRRVIEYRVCRPTSWRRRQAEEAGLPWPTPPRGRQRRAA